MIHKHLRRELSDPDQLDLKKWLDQDSEHRQILKDMEKAWQLSNDYQTDFTPDLKKGLKSLRKRIASDQANVRSLTPKGKKHFFRFPYSIAASLLLLIAALAVWNFGFRPPDMLSATTGPGEQKVISLTDGSRVILNEHSTLSYPSFFRADREVRLSGEAFFEVHQDKQYPFTVMTHRTKTEVLGTSFNLRAYQDEPFTEIEVLEGVVQLMDIEGEQPLELKKGTRGTYQHKADTVLADQPKTLNAVFWKDRRLRFKRHQLKEAIAEINRRLDIQINLSDTAIASCSFSGGITIEHRDTIVAVLAGNFNASWEKTAAGRYLISGGSCE